MADRPAPEPSPLETWRAKALWAVLVVIAAGGALAYVTTVVNALLQGRMSLLLWVYIGVYAAFLAVAFIPRLDTSLRAGLVFLLAYVNAAASLARVGLEGSGRLYLVFVPVAAVILIGPQAGWVALGLSLAIFGGFGALAAQGILAQWMTPEDTLSAAYWTESGAALAAFLVILTLLMDRFFVRHMHTLAASRATSKELERAYGALQDRVATRTRELALLNNVAAVVSGRVGLAEILDASLRRALEAFSLETGGAYELAADGTLVLRAHAGLSAGFVASMERVNLDIALDGKPLDLEHPETWSLDDYPPGPMRDAITREGLVAVVGVPLVSKGRVLGVLVLNSRQPRALGPDELSLLVAVGQQIGLAMENARLLEAERGGREEAERRRDVAEGLRETLAVLNSHKPLAEILDFVVRQSCRLMACDAASLLQADADCCTYRVTASCGLDRALADAVIYSEGNGGAGGAIEARQPVAFPDLETLAARHRTSLIPDHPEDRRHRELLLSHGYRATLSIPLLIRSGVFGAITLYYRQPRQFGPEDVRLATALADQAALAVDNARLHEDSERAAAMAERNRLARELHDSVTQSLYSVTLYAEAAARHMDAGSTGEAAGHLRELGDTAREALREMRLLIFELNPPALDRGGLVDALQIRLDAVESRGGLTVGFTADGTEKLSPPVRKEVYAVAQEALNNAIKHSRARSVRIELRFGGSGCDLSIADDGVGFDVAAARRGGGVGLRSIGERVQKIGGTVEVQSSPGAGTRVRIRVPGA